MDYSSILEDFSDLKGLLPVGVNRSKFVWKQDANILNPYILLAVISSMMSGVVVNLCLCMS